MTAYPHLLAPIDVAGLRLRNRVVMGSMHTGLEEIDGGMERLAAFYGERAHGGVGLIVSGGYSPNLAGSFDGTDHCVMATADQAQRHAPVTQAVHREGGRILLQLLHTGRYGKHGGIVAPSAIRSPINRETPRAMDADEIEATIADYINAARLAKDAGYDGVEVMGSEGYLINQFIALRTNHRHDDWGGAYENRIRLPVDIVRGIRQACGPGFVVMYRLSVLDIVDGGSTWPEVVELARAVEEAGADILNSGIGWHEAQVPTIAQPVPRGGFVWRTAQLRDHVTVPVVAVNRINTPDVAESIVAEGRADMVSMARPFLADPDIVVKAAADHADEINTCIACNQACLDHIFSGKVSSCLVNPRACHETLLTWEDAPVAKHIAIVGAGPAGMACAAVAAERGHKVVLFDAEDRVGGQFNLARNVPGKAEFDETLRYYRGRLDRAGVELRLGEAVSAHNLADEGFDHVVLATGIVPRVPTIPGVDHPKVASYADILTGRKPAGSSVAVIGGGGIAFDVALFLVEQGSRAHIDEQAFRETWGVEADTVFHMPAHKVTMLQRTPGAMGRSLGKTTGWVHRLTLKRAGVEQIGGVTYDRIDDQGLHITVDGKAQTLAVDTVVICAGQVPRDDLAGPLTAAGMDVHIIGGAKDATELDAKRAFDEGVRLGAEL